MKLFLPGNARKLVILSLSLLVLTVGCAYYNTLFNAKKNYEEGIKALQKNPTQSPAKSPARKYFEATIEKSWKLIEIYSDKSKYADDAFLYICKSEYNLQRYTQAQLHLEQFLKKYSNSKLIPEAYLWYGKTLMKMQDEEEAIEYLNRAINSTKDKKIRAEAYFELGFNTYEKGEYDRAVENFLKALKEKPDDQYRALIQYYLGEAYFIQKDYENAIKQYKKVTEYSPTIDIEFQTRYHLARSLAARRKYKEAFEILRKMLTAPRFKNFYSMIKTTMGEIYERQGQYADAIETYREILKEKRPDEGTAQASLNLARIYERQFKNVDSAVVYYGKVKAIYARYDSVSYAENKKVFLRELKDIRDAIRRDTRLVRLIQTDKYFRDSLFQAQFEDSLRRVIGDTLQYTEVDSVNQIIAKKDTLVAETKGARDSLKNPETNPSAFEELARTERDIAEGNLNEQDLDSKIMTSPDEKKTAEKKPSQESAKKKKIKVEKRKLPKIKEDLKNNHFHLAEYFLLRVGDLDSAAVRYRKFLNLYQDSILTPKALYSLAYIYSQKPDANQHTIDSLKNELLTRYPNSVFAEQLSTDARTGSFGQLQEASDELAHRRFLDAEMLYFSNQIDSALQVYQEVAQFDSNSVWSAKAQYAMAYIYEHDLQDYARAIRAYQYLIQHFPTRQEFVSLAEKKLAPIHQKQPATESGSAPLASDTTGGSNILADSTRESTFAETQLESSDVSGIANFEKKKQWRKMRDKKFNQRNF